MRPSIVLCAGLALLPLAARGAATSIVLAHEGRLLDGNDQPVDQSGLAMRFEFYAEKFADAGQTPAWSADCNVDVSHGNYAVLLGGDCGSGLTTLALPFGVARYLQVSIGGVALAPRLLLGEVPGAAEAQDALTLDGLTPDELWKKTDQVDAATVGGKTLDELTAGYDGRYVRSQPGGAVTIAGDLTATSFAGDGAQLTNLSESALPATIARLDATSPQTFVGSIAAASFAGDGSGLTNLSESALPATIARLDQTSAQAFAGSVAAPSFAGDGSRLTGLDAGKLASGTVPGARLSGTYPGVLTLSNTANAISGTFTGDGSRLTGLDAGQLGAGLLPDGRLAGTYSSDLTFAGTVAFTGTMTLPVVTSLPANAPSAGAVVLNTGDGTLYVSTGSAWMAVGATPGTIARPGTSCAQLHSAGVAASGLYYVDFGSGATQVSCDMQTGGGGWTLALRLDTGDSDHFHYNASIWTDASALGSPTGNYADFKGPAYGALGFDRVLVKSFHAGTLEAWKSYAGASRSSLVATMSQSCVLLGTAQSSGGSPHALDPILNGSSLYANCTNVENNADNVRLSSFTTCGGDAVYGLGLCGDSCVNWSGDARPNAGQWYCGNGSNRYYGVDNGCYPGSTLPAGDSLGDYAWEIYVQ